MKDYPLKRAILLSTLACSILLLGLEPGAAGPRPSRGRTTDSVVTPNTTFTDNVIIDTSSSPKLSLMRNTSQGGQLKVWNLLGGNDFLLEDFTSGNVPFEILSGAPSASLVVAGNGNVGIRTNDPQASLHIRGGINPAIRLEQTMGGAAHVWSMLANDDAFSIVDDTAGLYFLNVKADTGNVGIGTVNPFGHLHVAGFGAQLSIFQGLDNNAVQFRLQTNSTNRRFVALNAIGQQQSQLVFGDNGAFDFLGATVNDVRMTLLANGNVGIGTTTPDQKLSVNGGASKPGGGSWATFSDERLKNIKGEFTSGLGEVLKLKPIRYEYKADNAEGIKSEGEHIGFGAQEVQKIIPEAVIKNSDGYLMVDNDPILWTMLNAIKEQNAQIAAQEGKLNTQTEEIAELKAQLAQLQTQVVLQAANPKPSPRRLGMRASR